MNNVRRKAIDGVKRVLQPLLLELSIILSEVTDLFTEEEEALENIPENLQDTERYEQTENAVDCLEIVIDTISEFLDADLIDTLTEAQG